MHVSLAMLTRPFVAAVVLSSVAHAAIALIASDTVPSSANPVVRQAASSKAHLLHVALSLQPSQKIRAVSQTASEPVLLKSASLPQPVPTREQAIVAPRSASSSEIATSDVASSSEEQSEPPTRPTPLTYPLLAPPPGDDPHIVGLVRLLLVVASDGKVVKTIVTASTLSQDYVDRVTKSFEEMRFKPGRLRGLPHPGWYEVVVNFDFEPPAAASL